MLIQFYLQHMQSAEAETIAANYARRFPENGSLIRLHAETLIETGQYQDAADLLMSSNLLPAEGAKKAHSLYREAYLMLAVQSMKAGSFHQALKQIAKAREWPENLGVGEPYPRDVDDRLEDWLAFQCYRGLGMREEAQRTLKILALQLWPKAGNLNNAKPRYLEGNNAGGIIQALALKQYGHAAEGQKVLEDWMKQDTSRAMASWGVEVFEGRSVSLPSTVQDPGCRVLAALLREQKK